MDSVVSIRAMGSYAHIFVGELVFDWAKNTAPNYWLLLFCSAEKRIIEDGRESLPSVIMRDYSGSRFTASAAEPAVFYRASVPAVRERLELMGYTADVSRGAFRGVVGVDEWIEGIARLISNHKQGCDTATNVEPAMLAEKDSSYGVEGDWYAALRLALDLLDSEEDVICDLTDVAAGGWVAAEEDLVDLASNEAQMEVETYAPILVLTEGSSDSSILEQAMRVLCPSVAHRFSFMDFGGNSNRAAGGAGELAKLIRAFAASGVANRVIALFDNDTAAAEARRSLDESRLPRRFAVRSLPDVDLLRSYPTRGPDGEQCSDINGRAGSIELYLGEDVLRQSDGKLTPVQWKSYNTTLNAWQGQVDCKARLQECFRQKASAALPEDAHKLGWREMREVCRVLLGAFQEHNASRIMAEAESSVHD